MIVQVEEFYQTKLKHFDAYGQNARPAGWNPALQARGRVAGRMPADIYAG